MPLYRNIVYGNSEIIIWKYDETENFDDLVLSENDLAKIQNYHPKKKAEFLMVRRILSEKLHGNKILYKEDGEPFLKPKDREISISHSFPYVALALSRQKVGVDLEAFKEKIINIKDKFIRQEEQLFIPKHREVEYLTIIWSVKEALYKIHHSNYWSLKKHYEVRPFLLEDLSEISCRVHDEDFSDEFTARAEIFDGYCLTLVG